MGKLKGLSLADNNIPSCAHERLGLDVLHRGSKGKQGGNKVVEQGIHAGAQGQDGGTRQASATDDRSAQQAGGRAGKKRQGKGSGRRATNTLRAVLFFTVLALFTSTSARAPIKRESSKNRAGSYHQNAEQIRQYFKHKRKADSLDLVIKELTTEISRHEYQTPS